MVFKVATRRLEALDYGFMSAVHQHELALRCCRECGTSVLTGLNLPERPS